MLILDQLAAAINSRTPVVLEYQRQGKTPGPRYGNPYAIYMVRTKDHPEGRWYLDWYQTDGASERGKLPDWRQLILTDVVFLNSQHDLAPFNIIDTYKPNSERYNQVFAKV